MIKAELLNKNYNFRKCVSCSCELVSFPILKNSPATLTLSKYIHAERGRPEREAWGTASGSEGHPEPRALISLFSA